MSGPGLEPTCRGIDKSQEFFEPDTRAGNFNVTYQPDQDVQIVWSGGKNTSSQVQQVSLYLVQYDEPRLDVMTIIDNETFTWAESETSNWTWEDECGNTGLSYIWRVPHYFYNTTNTPFRFTALNKSSVITSPGFFIRPNTTSTTIATAPTTSETSSVTPTPTSSVSTSPKPTGLSTSAKAGIGTGCSAIGLLVLLGILIYMKRQRTQSSPSLQTSSGYEKSELDGKVAEQRAAELGGAEILESDCQAKKQPPVELASD